MLIKNTLPTGYLLVDDYTKGPLETLSIGDCGYFHTSTIQNIEQKQENNKSFLILETKNSKYKVECVEEFKIHYNKGSEPEV